MGFAQKLVADAVQRGTKSCHAAFLACRKVAFEHDRQTDTRRNKHQILGTLYTKGPKGQLTLYSVGHPGSITRIVKLVRKR